MSNLVPQNEQGELQGGLAGLISVTSIAGPLLMTGLFATFTSARAPFHFPGAPFFMGAFLSVVSLMMAVRALKK
jgi:DHA1 family tetracycline resistance protein-like MFS transporter